MLGGSRVFVTDVALESRKPIRWLFTRMSALITLQSKTVWNIKNVRNVLLQYVALMEQGINKSERNELYIFIMIMILANQRLILE